MIIFLKKHLKTKWKSVIIVDITTVYSDNGESNLVNSQELF